MYICQHIKDVICKKGATPFNAKASEDDTPCDAPFYQDRGAAQSAATIDTRQGAAEGRDFWRLAYKSKNLTLFPIGVDWLYFTHT